MRDRITLECYQVKWLVAYIETDQDRDDQAHNQERKSNPQPNSDASSIAWTPDFSVDVRLCHVRVRLFAFRSSCTLASLYWHHNSDHTKVRPLLRIVRTGAL